jgi:hypothetical protein
VIAKLNSDTFNGGVNTCPKQIVPSLAKIIEAALPYSDVFVFSDGSADDFTTPIKEKITDLIETKKVTVNFILTGFCGDEKVPENEFNTYIEGISRGQIFKVDPFGVEDLLIALRITLDPNYIRLKPSKKVEGKHLNVAAFNDRTTKQLTITATGGIKNITLLGSFEQSQYLKPSFKNKETFVSSANGSTNAYFYTYPLTDSEVIRVGGISQVSFNFGFSQNLPESQEFTYVRPIKGQKNILSVFVSDSSLIKILTSVTIVSRGLDKDIIESTNNLTLNNGFYSTEPIEFPDKVSEIRLLGADGYFVNFFENIKRVLATNVESIDSGKFCINLKFLFSLIKLFHSCPEE